MVSISSTTKSTFRSRQFPLAKGADVVCIFVNAECNAQVIEKLVEYGVKLIALRCAGFNNVDLKAAKGRIDVVHVLPTLLMLWQNMPWHSC